MMIVSVVLCCCFYVIVLLRHHLLLTSFTLHLIVNGVYCLLMYSVIVIGIYFNLSLLLLNDDIYLIISNIIIG